MVLRNDLRGQADQADIVLSIISRLIDQVPELTEQNCFLCDQAVPESLPGGRYCVTVSIGRGQFPHEYFAGGGTDTLTEDGVITVTPIVITYVDRLRTRLARIIGRKGDQRVPSIVYFKSEILKALLAVDWEPSNQSDSTAGEEIPLLRDLLSPLSVDGPSDVRIGEANGTAMQIQFSTVFDWKL